MQTAKNQMVIDEQMAREVQFAEEPIDKHYGPTRKTRKEPELKYSHNWNRSIPYGNWGKRNESQYVGKGNFYCTYCQVYGHKTKNCYFKDVHDHLQSQYGDDECPSQYASRTRVEEMADEQAWEGQEWYGSSSSSSAWFDPRNRSWRKGN